MSVVIGAVKLFEGLNLAIELITAGSTVMNKLVELQTKRAAEGREVTNEDVAGLMTQGDVNDAIERARLAVAKAAQDASGTAQLPTA